MFGGTRMWGYHKETIQTRNVCEREGGAPTAAEPARLQFLECLTLKVWKARAEGEIIGAAFVLGTGFLLYLVMGAGPLNLISAFLYASMLVMVVLLRQRVLRKP